MAYFGITIHKMLSQLLSEVCRATIFTNPFGNTINITLVHPLSTIAGTACQVYSMYSCTFWNGELHHQDVYAFPGDSPCCFYTGRSCSTHLPQVVSSLIVIL